MALVFDDYEYQPAGTRDTAKTSSFFDSIKALITPPKVAAPSGPPPPSSGIWDSGNEWIDNSAGGHWRAADGQIWSNTANSWVEDPTAAIAAVSRVGNAITPVAPEPTPVDPMQQWLATPNEGRAGSQFDRMGFQEAPTNAGLLGYYTDQQARQQTLSQILGFANKAAGATNFYSPEQRAFNSAQEDPTGWGGQPKNAFGNDLATNRDPGLGLSQILKAGGSAYGTLDRNLLRPFEETAAQLTGPVLKFSQMASNAGAGIPGAGPAISGVSALTGWKPDMGGVGELAGSIRESGGSPVDFRDAQNRKFAKRPVAQQLLASTVYDPTNLLGVGIGAKALETGAVASKIGRGLATADKAIDVAQAKAALPIMGGVAGFTASATTGGDTKDNLIAAVVGAVGAKAAPIAVQKLIGEAALRAAADPEMARALKALGDEYGLKGPAELFTAAASGTDGGLQARIGEILRATPSRLADESGAVDVRLAALPVKAATKVALPAIGGYAGYKTAPEDATPMEKALYAIGGAAAGAALQYGTPQIAKLKRAEKPIEDIVADGPIAVGAFGRDRGLGTKVTDFLKSKTFASQYMSDPATYRQLQDYLTGRVYATGQARSFAEKVYADIRNAFPMDAEGRVEGLPYLTQDGSPLLDADGVAVVANPDIQQIAAVLPHYFQYLSDDQVAALMRAKNELANVHSVYEQVGLTPPSGAKGVIDGGFYMPRWTKNNEEVLPVIAAFNKKPGGTIRSEKGRKFETMAEGEAAGKDYLAFVDSLEAYANDTYRKAWDAAAATQLKESGLALPPAKAVGAEIEEELKNLRAELKGLRTEARGVEAKLGIANRDVRAMDAQVAQRERRMDELLRQAANRDESMTVRRAAADEASAIARTELRETTDAAIATARMAGVTGQISAQNIRAANGIEARLAALEEELRAAAGLGEVVNPATGVRLPAIKAQGRTVDEVLIDIANTTTEGKRIAAKMKGVIQERMGIPVAMARTNAESAGEVAKAARGEVRKAQTRAVNTAERSGVLKPDETMAALQREHEVLDRQINQINSRGATTAERQSDLAERLVDLESQKEVAQAKMMGIRKALSSMRGANQVAREAAMQSGAAEIRIAGLEGYLFPSRTVNAWNIKVKPGGLKDIAANYYDALNDSLRTIQATGDFSAFGVQLAKLAYTEPGSVMKAFGEAVRYANDPAGLGQYILRADSEAAQALEPLVADMAKHGTYISTGGELTTSAHGRTQITRAIENSPVIGTRVIEPSNRLFDNMGNFARIDLFKVLWRNAAQIMGVEATNAPENMRAIAKAVNTATGYAERGPMSGALPSRLLFAGRFFQSTLDTIGKAALDLHTEGAVAREHILRMIGIGTLLTYAANEALGQKTEFNPIADGGLNSNFMRIRAGGHDISLFGPWDSLVRGLITAGEGDPMTFVRSKLGPVASIAMDFAPMLFGEQPENAIGEDPRSKEAIAARILPFSVSGMGKEATAAREGKQSWGAAAIGSGFQLVGIKATPMTEREQREAESAKSGTPYSKMTPKEQQDYDAIHGAIKSDSDYAKRAAEIDAQRKADEATLVSKFLPPDGTPKREEFRNEVSRVQREAALIKKEALGNLADFDMSKPDDRNKAALWEYYDSWSKSSIAGMTDFDAQAKRLAEYEANWTPEQKRYVEQRRTAEHVPAVQKLMDDKKKLGDSGLWDIYDNAWAAYKEKNPTSVAAQYGSYEEWYDARIDVVRKLIVADHPDWAEPQVLKEATKAVTGSNTAKEFDKLKTLEKEDWVLAHKNDGLARLAAEWQYITAKRDLDVIYGKK